MRRGISVILLLCLGFSGVAGGFQLNTQGVRALGMGGAFLAWANDPSSLFFNPGECIS